MIIAWIVSILVGILVSEGLYLLFCSLTLREDFKKGSWFMNKIMGILIGYLLGYYIFECFKNPELLWYLTILLLIPIFWVNKILGQKVAGKGLKKKVMRKKSKGGA